MNHKGHEGHKGKTLGFSEIPEQTERITYAVIGGAIEVHRTLGPGFLERIYKEALSFELRERGLSFAAEQALVVRYKSLSIGGQRVDLIVEGCVIVELKAVVRFEPIHEAIVMSYLRSTGIRLGLLMNFHAPTLRAGLTRLSCKNVLRALRAHCGSSLRVLRGPACGLRSA